MSTATTTNRSTWTVDAYCDAFATEVFRVAKGMLKCVHKAGDIVGIVGEKFSLRIDFYMERYENPVVFANAVTRRTVIDYLRRENVQRGAGVHGKREVVSADAPIKGTELTAFDVEPDRFSEFEACLVSRLDDEYELAKIRLGVPTDEWDAMHLTFGCGYTDAEAGAVLGVARETVNRRKRRGLGRGV